MKTSKEFFEKLHSDEAFAKEVTEKVKAKMDAGEQDYKALWIPLAAEYGYELTGEELDEAYAQLTAEVSDEELGKVAGGSTPACGVALVLSYCITVPATIKITVDIVERIKN